MQDVRRSQQEWESYRKRSHLSQIASLLCVLLLFLAGRHIRLEEKVLAPFQEQRLQLLQLEVVKRAEPQKAPPKLVIPRTVHVDQPEKVPEKITKKVRPVRRRRAPKVDPRLRLNASFGDLYRNGSSLGSLDGPQRKRGSRDALDTGPSISRNLGVDVNVQNSAAGLDVAVSKPRAGRKKTIEVANPAAQLVPAAARKAPAPVRKQQATRLIDGDVSVVITSGDLSIGDREYQLWNRLNAEFDRWDKGRYGALPKFLSRSGRAIVADFGYGDGSAHHIIWNRGNTRIMVRGKSKRERIGEINQAIQAMLQLNLNKTGL